MVEIVVIYAENIPLQMSMQNQERYYIVNQEYGQNFDKLNKFNEDLFQLNKFNEDLFSVK